MLPKDKLTHLSSISNTSDTTRWQIAVACSQGKSIKDIAAAVGLSERMVYKHLDHADTQSHIRKIRAALLDSISSRLSDSATHAIRTLRALCDSDKESIRLKASLGLLEHFKALTYEQVLGSQTTPELVFAALPLIVQAVGKDAIMDAIGVQVDQSEPLPGREGPSEALPAEIGTNPPDATNTPENGSEGQQ